MFETFFFGIIIGFAMGGFLGFWMTLFPRFVLTITFTLLGVLAVSLILSTENGDTTLHRPIVYYVGLVIGTLMGASAGCNAADMVRRDA